MMTYTAKILPRLSANFTCVPIVHCKPPGTIACITNILSLPRRVSWYDQHFLTVSIPNNFHGISSKDLCFYQDLFLTFKLEKSCFCQEFLLYISMIPSCSRQITIDDHAIKISQNFRQLLFVMHKTNAFIGCQFWKSGCSSGNV